MKTLHARGNHHRCMKQGTVLVAGNGDLKYPGYSSYLTAKVTYIPPTSSPAAGRENEYGSILVIAADLRIRPLASENPHVGRVLDGVLING